MAFKNKPNRSEKSSPKLNHSPGGITMNPVVKLSPTNDGSYFIHKGKEELCLRKPLSSNSTNKMHHSRKKYSITSETVRAAEEILAVLQDSPVKNKNIEKFHHNKPQLTKCDNISNKDEGKRSSDKKDKKCNDMSEKLNSNDIAGMFFANDKSGKTEKTKKLKNNFVEKKNTGSLTNGHKTCFNRAPGKSPSSHDRRNTVFDEEDIFVSLSDSDDSVSDDSFSDETKTDKVNEWTVTKSPRIKSPRQYVNRKNHVINSNKSFLESNVRRSLASELESPKANGSVNSPLRLKLKRKAPAPVEGEPANKERKTKSSSEGGRDKEFKGLRCRLMIKLPKWRLDEDESSVSSVWSPVKSISNTSLPATPEIPKAVSSPIVVTLKESKPSVASTKENINSKKKSRTPLLKSAAEIFDLLSTPEKMVEVERKPCNVKSPVVKNLALKKLQDDSNSLMKEKSSDLIDKNVSENIRSSSSNGIKGTPSDEISSPRRSKRMRESDLDIGNLNNDLVICPSPLSKRRKNDSIIDVKPSPTAKVVNSPSCTPTKNNIHKPEVTSSTYKLSNKTDVEVRRPCKEKNNSDGLISKELFSIQSESEVMNGSFKKIGKEVCYISLEEARSQLLASTVPQSLPCRDKEFNNIYSFILRKIEDMAGGCMYISGVPGTGKTATVHAVVKKLQLDVSQDNVPQFDFVEINGLRLTEPRQAYTRIWQTLTGQRLTPEQAQRSLDRRFSFNAKKPTVLLVDELDYLCNRRQDVVYSILDWPTKQGSALVILTIANTMDLPERTLKGKVTSRMGLTRLVFQPYTHHQLQEIVLNRLSGNESFHPDAVQLVARKVAAVSGDARRALDICRRATELVDSSSIVSIKNVEQALSQIFTGPRIRAIRSCSRMAQFVLRALRDETLRTGVDESSIGKVYSHLTSICTLEGIEKPTTGDVLSIATSLEHLGLVVAEKGRPDIMRKLSLNVSSDDIHYALSC